MANHQDTDKPVYKGTERRKSARRYATDRRAGVRWEPDKPNRRQKVGRRSTDHLGLQGHKR
jgi:hypothetical protein